MGRTLLITTAACVVCLILYFMDQSCEKTVELVERLEPPAYLAQAPRSMPASKLWISALDDCIMHLTTTCAWPWSLRMGLALLEIPVELHTDMRTGSNQGSSYEHPQILGSWRCVDHVYHKGGTY